MAHSFVQTKAKYYTCKILLKAVYKMPYIYKNTISSFWTRLTTVS